MRQKWLVMLELIETEGKNSPEPWYTRYDIENLVRTHLGQEDIRDITIESIQAKAVDARYL